MIRIRLYDHPFGAGAPKELQADSLGQFLLDYYGAAPRVTVQVFRGEPSAETEITGDVAAILANDAEEYVILQSPGAGWGQAFYWVMTIIMVASVLLAPKPSMPGNVNRTQQSPNNALGKRENQVRLLERIEDIYGTVKSVPSLMMPTYTKYISHSKYEYGYYCVGRGYYALDQVRDGETLIADITGAAVAVYDPFTSPNSGDAPVLEIGDAIIDDVVTVERNIAVDGITLKAWNQVNLPASADYTFTPDAGGDIITQAVKAPNFNAVATAGQTITIDMDGEGVFIVTNAPSTVTVTGATRTYTDDGGAGVLFARTEVGDVITIAGFVVTEANNGTFTVATKSANAITVTTGSQFDEISGAAAVTVTEIINYSGTRTIASVSDGSITLTGATFSQGECTGTAGVTLDAVTNWTDWITLPGDTRTEVWVNIVAPNGMFADAGGGKGNATVSFAAEIEQLDANLDPLGVVETATGSLSGATSDERAETVEHATAWTGPARVRMRRTTDYNYAFEGTVIDEIKWADLNAVSPVDQLDFGNLTTLHTVTQATTRATAVKSRQLNCLASRLLPTYNGTTFSGALDADGALVSGTLNPTSKICDILVAVSIDPKIGARDLAIDLDLAQLWSVQQQLDAWHAAAGQFNFTFDSDNTSYEETAIMIANAGFCIAYRQSGKIRLAFDQAQTSSTALFTHRNKKPKAETITRRFASDGEHDGVEFVYSDPDSTQPETIKLPLDGSATKYKKFEIPGIRSFDQAWLRANREYYKLVGQRVTIETGTLMDARALLPNSRVDIVDNTRFKSYDGEVVGQSGLELRLSRDVAFAEGLPHSIVLMRRDGSLQSIACTAGSAPNRVLLGALPSEALVTRPGGADGVRTIFSFAADSARGAMAWLVQEIDLSDGQYAKVRAINYSADYYQADLLAIPDKTTIIN